MNIGRYIFSQVVDYIPRYQFDKLVAKYHGDWHAKELTCYNQLLHLLFGQLTNCDSLRDICLCLKAHEDSLYHLGFRNTVEHSSLSRANENRDYRIYEELGMYLIGIVRPLYARTKKIKKDCHSSYSITEVATLIRVSALERTPLRELITMPNNLVNLNHNVTELTLFDDM